MNFKFQYLLLEIKHLNLYIFQNFFHNTQSGESAFTGSLAISTRSTREDPEQSDLLSSQYMQCINCAAALSLPQINKQYHQVEAKKYRLLIIIAVTKILDRSSLKKHRFILAYDFRVQSLDTQPCMLGQNIMVAGCMVKGQEGVVDSAPQGTSNLLASQGNYT